MKELLHHPISCALCVVPLIAFALSWSLFYFRLRQRGYRSNIIALFIGGSCVAGILGATALLLLVDRDPLSRMMPSHWEDKLVVQFAFACVGFASCSISIMQILLRLMPVRRPHVVQGGFRKGWFYVARITIAIGILLVFAALALSLLPLLMPGRYEDDTPRALLLFFAALMYFHLGRGYLRRARASRQIGDVLKSDARRPVLYIRAFKDESRFFDFVPPRTGRSIPHLADHGYLSLDLYIADAVERMIGPFIALGNPDDFFPPAGAARGYVHSVDWREEFKALVVGCRAVLVLPANTRELDWEMSYLLGTGNAGKLFLLFGRWVYEFPENPLDKFFNTSVKPLVWSEFWSSTSRIGYRLPTARPSAGTVMSFNPMGEFKTISRTCASPEDYVRAILDCITDSVPVFGERTRGTPP